MGQFLGFAFKFVERYSPRRIAVGAQFAFTTATIAQSTEALRHKLKSVNLIEGEASDFLFRINRPRMETFGMFNTTVNRLCQWLTQNVQFTWTVADDTEARNHSEVLSLMIPDINTPDAVNLSDCPVEIRKSLTERMFMMAKEFALEGESL